MTDDGRTRPLEGATAWLITDEKIGMQVQSRGVADALGVKAIHKQVSPRGVRRALAPWGGVARSEGMGLPGSLFAPPWPALAIA